MNKPHSESRLARFVSKRILDLKGKKTQARIASEAGFPNPNVVTMIKQGSSKLALDRVPAMAIALDCDPALLLRFALEQEAGETAARAITEIFGTPVTGNEQGWIAEIREASDHSDPRITTRGRAAIRALFGK